MKRFALFLIVLVACVFAAAPAFAECQEPIDEWYVNPGPYAMEADGSVGLNGFNEFGSGPTEAELSSFVFRLDPEGTEVPGTLEVIEAGLSAVVVWTPESPLEAGQRIVGNSVGGDFEEFSIDVVDSYVPPTVTVNGLERREFSYAARRVCCESNDRCDDPCGSTCEACEIEEYAYVTHAAFSAEIQREQPEVNHLWIIAYEVLNADGMTRLEGTDEQIQVTSLDRFSAFVAGLSEEEEAFCVRHEVRNVVTGDVASTDTTCAETTTFSPANVNETQTLDTAVCSGDTVQITDYMGGFESVPLDEYELTGGGGGGGTGDGGAKESTGGCATGSGNPGAALLLLGMLLAVRRRRG